MNFLLINQTIIIINKPVLMRKLNMMKNKLLNCLIKMNFIRFINKIDRLNICKFILKMLRKYSNSQKIIIF